MKNILVVDDEQLIRNILKELLERKNYSVTVAVDGKDALDKMTKEAFDLFLTDISMPNMDGYELITEIKKIQPLAVIIVLTGYSSIEGAVKSIHSGAFQYLTKPIRAAELYDVVSKGLKKSEDLYGPLQKQYDPGFGGMEQSEPIMIHGFTSEDKIDFLSLGVVRKFTKHESIPIDKLATGAIYMVEEGDVSVWLNNTSIDFLKKFDTWGEESFLLSSSVDVSLRAETEVKLRIFDRKRIFDFFSYKGESLLKRFILNLSTATFFKWRKSIQRITMLQSLGKN